MTIPFEHFEDDTILNVVDFFKADTMGRVRRYTIDLAVLLLDDGLVAHDVHAEFRLSRVGAGLLVEGTAEATVELICVRTLEPYPEAVETEFAEQFRPIVDITGRTIKYAENDAQDDPLMEEIFAISENHELDMAEPLRQVIVVALPMQPVKPGTAAVRYDDEGDEPGRDHAAPDARRTPFAVLGTLLRDDE